MDVLGKIFDACTANDVVGKPVSRLHVRQYLKVLLDRNLVLGTVDRPQLHDVMLDYVTKHLSKEVRQVAQRRFVELLRNGVDRSSQSSTGIYIRDSINHHIKEAYDEAWAKRPQAISWVEDHINGVQDSIAFSAASVLPTETLAVEAEDEGEWWKAALRWHATSHVKTTAAGINFIGLAEMKKAAEAADKVVAASGAGAGDSSNPCKDDLDMFTLHVLMGVMAGWVTSDIEVYGDRLKKLSEECNVVKRKPVFQHQIIMTTEWWGLAVAGDIEKAVAVNWKMIRTNLNALYPEDNEASSNDAAFHIDDVEHLNAKVLTFGWLYWASKKLYTSLDATACAPSKSATSCHSIMLTCVILMTSPRSSGRGCDAKSKRF